MHIRNNEVAEVPAKVPVLPSGKVTRKSAGQIFGKTAKTLCHWKAKGWGPRAVTIGGREFYDYAECMAMARGEKPIKPLVGA